MQEYTIRLIDYAVSKWVEFLRTPEYRNGDPSTNGLYGMLWTKDLPKNNDEKTLHKFGKELRKLIIQNFDEDETTSRSRGPGPSPSLWTDPHLMLDVDYVPCEILQNASKNSGLNMAFPWKSYVEIRDFGVHVQMGYGKKDKRTHYPLKDGRVLKLDLSGVCVLKILKLIEKNVIDLNLEMVLKGSNK